MCIGTLRRTAVPSLPATPWIVLIIGLAGPGCGTLRDGSSQVAVSPDVRTRATVGDRPFPIVIGPPGDRVTAGRDRSERVVDPEGTISGRVVDARGEPVAGARVRLAADASSVGRLARATTDEAGGFTLRGLRPGSPYTLIAEYEDEEGVVAARVRAQAPEDRVRIALIEEDSDATTTYAGPRIDRASGRVGAPEVAEADRRESPLRINPDDFEAAPAPEADRVASPREDFEPENPRRPGSATPAWKASATRSRDRDGAFEPVMSPAKATPPGRPRPARSRSVEQEDDDGPNPLPPAIEIGGRGTSPGPAPMFPDRAEVSSSHGRPPAEPVTSPPAEPASPTNNEDGFEPMATPEPETVRPPSSSEPELPDTSEFEPIAPAPASAADPVPAEPALPAIPSPAPPPVPGPSPSDEVPMPEGQPETAAPAPAAFPPPPVVEGPSGPTDVEAPSILSEDTLPEEFAPVPQETMLPDTDVTTEAPPPPVDMNLLFRSEGPVAGEASSAIDGADAAPKRKTTWGELVAKVEPPLDDEKTVRRASALSNPARLGPSTKFAARRTPAPEVSPAPPARHEAGEAEASEGPADRNFCQFDAKEQRLIDFRLPDVDGRLVRFRDLDADLILLDFWGTWCAPCLESMPHLADLQKTYGPGRLRVVGIAYESIAPAKRAQAVAEVGRRLGLNYPLLLGEVEGPCPLQKALHVSVYPTMVLLDRHGRVLWRQEGATAQTLARLDRIIGLAARENGGETARR